MKLFDSVMWKYIKEENEVLSSLLKRTDIAEMAGLVKKYKTMYFVSHGSSYNSSQTIAPFLMKYADINVHCITAGNFISSDKPAALLDKDTTLVVLISQTGNSRGTLEGAQMAHKHGLKTLGLSSDSSALLHEYTDYFLPLNCGEEDSNAKTKGMSSTLLVLLLLGLHIGQKKGLVTQQLMDKVFSELEGQCAELDEVYDTTFRFCDTNSFGKDLNNLYIIGSDMNYGLALEAQIKIMETMCIPTCAVDSEEFSHGTHRSINDNTSLLIIRTDKNKDIAEKIYFYFNKITKVYMLNTLHDLSRSNILNIKNHEVTQSILTIVEFIQIISAYAPELNGLDPNRDANNDFTELVETRI